MLTPAYDPWAGYEWPDRSGQLERAPRKKTTPPRRPVNRVGSCSPITTR
jgi:hypothetical protein